MKLSAALFFIAFSIICAAGCGMPRPQTDPFLDEAAWQSAKAILSLNQDIHTSKGTGNLRLTTSAGVESFQIAWAAQAPNRVRMTLSVMGHPVETIAADGERVTFISHTGRHKPHTPVSDDPDLEPYTKIPLKLSDLICMLLGQIPIKQYDDAWMLPEDQSRVRLQKKFGTHTQELTLTPGQPIGMLRLLDRAKNIRYEIHYHGFETLDKRPVPVDLTITDGKSRSARITISRFWSNIPVKESVFQLTQTGS
jgi:hypothetical protein